MAETKRVREGIRRAMAAKQFDDAIKLCDEGLTLDAEDKKLIAAMHANRARAHAAHAAASAAKVKAAKASNTNTDGDEGGKAHWRRSLQDATKAVYANPELISAFVLKAAALQGLGRWEEAEREMTECVNGPGREDQVQPAIVPLCL